VALDEELVRLASGPNFAMLTTLFPDGSPQTQVMWVDVDDEHVLVNTEVHRQKFSNVERDPRVAVTVWDAESPYRYVEVRGRVVGTVRGDEARRHIDGLSRRYRGRDYPAGNITSERVILEIAPDRVLVRGH
jgi:PPOX class probable F420-dependent enzyme